MPAVLRRPTFRVDVFKIAEKTLQLVVGREGRGRRQVPDGSDDE